MDDRQTLEVAYALGLEFTWDWDWDAQEIIREHEEDLPPEERGIQEYEVLDCCCHHDGVLLASLSGIVDADDDYRRVVEASLTYEAVMGSGIEGRVLRVPLWLARRALRGRGDEADLAYTCLTRPGDQVAPMALADLIRERGATGLPAGMDEEGLALALVDGPS